ELQYNANQLKNDTEKVTNLKALLEKLPTISQYAAFLPITPPEFRYMNCEISRVILPELLSIHLPSYPPYYHVRYEEIGGVINNIPHPIA
ncbi:TPA: streptolysin associated protein SagD, partial [Listeria innocua]|nr:streptolysin associated protein SagD [Listeria innocua]